MQLKDIRLSTKLYMGFGVVLLLLVLLGTIVYRNLNGIREENRRYVDSAHFKAFITEKIADHLKWVRTLESLFLYNLPTVDLQLDHTQCGLGKFIYGEEGAMFAASNPQAEALLEAMKGPHQALHESAKSVLAEWKQRHKGLRHLLKDRLDDHRKWVITLSEIVLSGNTDLSLQTDPAQCAFGRFLVGDACARYEKDFPLFKDLMTKVEAPHRRLHESAVKIMEALKQSNQTEAQAIYEQETLPAVAEVETVFREAIAAETTLEDAQGKATDILTTKTHEALANAQTAMDSLKSYSDKEAEQAEKSLLNKVRNSVGMLVSLSLAAIVIGLLTSTGLVRMITKPVNRVIAGLSAGSDQVSSASGQVASASQSLAQGASEQASSLEETSSSLEEMSSMTRQNADNSNKADSLMKEASGIIHGASTSMQRMSEAIEKIKASATETAKIIKTIDEIAFQTNLLALNAAVEAARAGEAGKGFAVVAEEVRNLARRSAEAAKNTADLIEGAQKNAESGVTVTAEVIKAFAAIEESSGKVATLVAEIAAASKEQSQGIDQVNTAVAEMDKVVQQNAASAEESASASEELSSQAQELNVMVNDLRGIVDGYRARVSQERPTLSPVPERHKNIRTVSHKPTSLLAEKKPPATRKSDMAKTVKPEEVIPLDDSELKQF